LSSKNITIVKQIDITQSLLEDLERREKNFKDSLLGMQARSASVRFPRKTLQGPGSIKILF